MPTQATPEASTNSELKALLVENNALFWPSLKQRTKLARTFEELFFLTTLRKKAQRKMTHQQEKLRLAIIGGYSLYPLRELIEQTLFATGLSCELFIGDFDNYVAEAMDETSPLYKFSPEIVFMIPAKRRCQYVGRLTDSREQVHAQAVAMADELLELCRQIRSHSKAEIILANYSPAFHMDPGPYRTRASSSDWTFRKLVNLELGLKTPPFVHVCDIEFLATRRGALSSHDERAWFESKQPWAPDFLVEVAHEVAHIIGSLRHSPKKVLVLDLDNTLWGGVIGDDGIDGIELGDTSPRGEAFKAFQRAILSLTNRGVLLAVASKNDHEKAIEPFEKHPEMVLKTHHIVSFKANWAPKSENIRQIARDLDLGLDSFVFVDDNPAEIEIVRQFTPEVSTLLLSSDPSEYVAQLLNSRWFEPRSITEEDADRTQQYRQEVNRKNLLESSTDMNSYLASLQMTAEFREFQSVDVPRISQLINKSNQFNLTTHRRTEAEVLDIMAKASYKCFTVRLSDRFGDHGLISVVICRIEETAMVIDTWLMSCRVLKRQVEEEVVNEILRLARKNGCQKVFGSYIPTTKNGMVKDLYSRMGFKQTLNSTSCSEYEFDCEHFEIKPTHILIQRRAYESN